MPLTWIFDLDNTLHDAGRYVFPQVELQMDHYLARHLALSQTEANALRARYYDLYGATLAGVVRHHRQIDPDHFLAETHLLPELPARLIPMRILRPSLKRLRGNKLLFTNGPQDYAETVLRLLGIAQHFDAVVSIEQVGHLAKPDIRAYRRMLARHRLNPRRCAMVEDTHANLAPARRLGMRTVWLSPKLRRGPHVHARLRNLHQLPKLARQRGWHR
ncbi:pyrimidine 5'-nucleotidase [Chitinimonas lacunae]|uniref:Pyrimidine 5'-nucleotidase n=1 Tax=Chitinimonas lacunae TaxID=1963018 RepID=A0ABV8MSE2_9NEIS